MSSTNDSNYHSNSHIFPIGKDQTILQYLLQDDVEYTGKVVHVLSHPHWDREWYLPFQHFRRKLVLLFHDLFKVHPFSVFTHVKAMNIANFTSARQRTDKVSYKPQIDHVLGSTVRTLSFGWTNGCSIQLFCGDHTRFS